MFENVYGVSQYALHMALSMPVVSAVVKSSSHRKSRLRKSDP